METLRQGGSRGDPRSHVQAGFARDLGRRAGNCSDGPVALAFRLTTLSVKMGEGCERGCARVRGIRAFPRSLIYHMFICPFIRVLKP